jgi:uncharacterized protein YqgC (DUF456 family)
VGDVGLFLVAVAIVVGLVGIVVPVLPGSFLVLGAILVWAFQEGGRLGWGVAVLATALIGAAQVLKYAVPGKSLRASGMPNSTLVVGAVLGIVGFFVIPVVGLPIGFVLGVYAVEWQRIGDASVAWSSTVLALKAVGVSILIELAGALLAAAAWLAAAIAHT